MKIHECIIIWAGPAGIGMALKLKELGIAPIILEQDEIWSSFIKWNSKTCFITPSFPGNAFGQVDLNSIDYASSPGFFHMQEHLNGKQYAHYLKKMVEVYALLVKENNKVIKVEKHDRYFSIHTENNTYKSRYLISGVGEFQFPYHGNIDGYNNALHSSQIKDYSQFNDPTSVVPIIGWYESSIDIAYNLYKKGIKSHIICPHQINNFHTSDPSKWLSLHTSMRFRELQHAEYITTSQDTIRKITKQASNYLLAWKKSKNYKYTHTPILATWFHSGLSYLGEHVSYTDKNIPELNKYDELEKTSNIFIVGPSVRHGDIIFCFIYKFRLRFGVVALEIAKRLGKNLPEKQIKDSWEKQGFYLSNLEPCWDECMC